MSRYLRGQCASEASAKKLTGLAWRITSLLLITGGFSASLDAQSAPLNLLENGSILVAHFGGRTLPAEAFGAEVAGLLERLLMEQEDVYRVVTPAELTELLTDRIATAVAVGGTVTRTALSCIRARQLAKAAGLDWVVCAQVVGDESAEQFRVLARMIDQRTGHEHLLAAVSGGDAQGVAFTLLRQLPR